jgi:hypothetical protein
MSSRLIISRSGRAAKVPPCRGSVTILTERIVVRAAGSGDRGHGGPGRHFTHLGSLFLP